MTAFHNKAMEQLEGMIGTLRVQISRLATKEAYWVFSGDDFDLKVSDPKHPLTSLSPPTLRWKASLAHLTPLS